MICFNIFLLKLHWLKNNTELYSFEYDSYPCYVCSKSEINDMIIDYDEHTDNNWLISSKKKIISNKHNI